MQGMLDLVMAALHAPEADARVQACHVLMNAMQRPQWASVILQQGAVSHVCDMGRAEPSAFTQPSQYAGLALLRLITEEFVDSDLYDVMVRPRERE